MNGIGKTVSNGAVSYVNPPSYRAISSRVMQKSKDK